MRHVVQRPQIHDHAVFTFVTKDEVRAKKVLGVVFQVDGKLACLGLVGEQTKAYVGKFRLVARNDILVGGGKDLRACFLFGDSHAHDPVAVGKQGLIGRLAEQVYTGGVFKADISAGCGKFNTACCLVGNAVNAAAERIVNVLNLGRNERVIRLNVRCTGEGHSGTKQAGDDHRPETT